MSISLDVFSHPRQGLRELLERSDNEDGELARAHRAQASALRLMRVMDTRRRATTRAAADRRRRRHDRTSDNATVPTSEPLDVDRSIGNDIPTARTSADGELTEGDEDSLVRLISCHARSDPEALSGDVGQERSRPVSSACGGAQQALVAKGTVDITFPTASRSTNRPASRNPFPSLGLTTSPVGGFWTAPTHAR